MKTHERQMYNNIHQVGSLENNESDNFYNKQPYRVYSPYGVSPTLLTRSGGGMEPKVLISYDKRLTGHRSFHDEVLLVYRACRRIYGMMRTQDECLRIFKVVFPELCRIRNSDREREVLDESVSPALQRIAKSWNPRKRLKKLVERIETLIGLPFDYDRTELVALLEDIMPVTMRIRKLTPREYFRLMGVDETDIDVIHSAGLSNSAMYRMAGNSIVVDVLSLVMRKVFIDKDKEVRPGEQLTFF